jgi:hypothetical protein
MNTLVQLLVASCISMALSGLVLRLLSQPLVKVLSRICPDEAAAAFWLRYTQVMLTLAPLLAAVATVTVVGTAGPLSAVRLSVIAALVGLLLGLYAVGHRLGGFVRLPALREPMLGGRS